MATRRVAITAGAATATALAIAVGCCGATPLPRPFTGDIVSNGSSPFAIVGDLQTTSMLEFWREDNDRERAIIVRRIAAARPAFLIMLGDLVSNGSSRSAWADFDELCSPLREARIPVFPVPGNHEYWLINGDLDNYFNRFPHIRRRSFYELTYGSLGLVFLNSNIDELPVEEWSEQSRWYSKALRRFDADPAIRGVLVLMHHPPYTNSTITSDEIHVQRDLVPAFIQAKKTLAMITGHVHSYERFARGGKAFIVSGGGGGPRAELSSGSGRRHLDDLYDGPSVRRIHYLSVTPSSAELCLTIDVIALEEGSEGFSTIDAFRLPYAGPRGLVDADADVDANADARRRGF